MKKTTATAALVALAFGFAAPIATPSFAQAVNAASQPIMSGQSMRTARLIGSPVFNAKGEKIGMIEDVLLNKGASEPMLVLSVGEAAGAKLVAVPLTDVTADGSKPMMMSATKEKLMAMTPFVYYTGAR